MELLKEHSLAYLEIVGYGCSKFYVKSVNKSQKSYQLIHVDSNSRNFGLAVKVYAKSICKVKDIEELPVDKRDCPPLVGIVCAYSEIRTLAAAYKALSRSLSLSTPPQEDDAAAPKTIRYIEQLKSLDAIERAASKTLKYLAAHTSSAVDRELVEAFLHDYEKFLQRRAMPTERKISKSSHRKLARKKRLRNKNTRRSGTGTSYNLALRNPEVIIEPLAPYKARSKKRKLSNKKGAGIDLSEVAYKIKYT